MTNKNSSDLNRWAATLFDRDEHLWVAYGGEFSVEANASLDRLAQVLDPSNWRPYLTHQGAKVALNPAADPQLDRRGEHVVLLRNLMFEFDGGTTEEQMAVVKASGIPYTSAVFSGNKSVHLILSLESPFVRDCSDGWMSLWKRVYVILSSYCHGSVQVDARTSQRAQWMRAPFGTRRNADGDLQEQRLLILNGRIPAVALDEWLYRPTHLRAWLRSPGSDPKVIRPIATGDGRRCSLVRAYADSHGKDLDAMKQVSVPCPCCRAAGNDRKGSNLSIAADDGRILIHCHAGCEFTDILAALQNT